MQEGNAKYKKIKLKRGCKKRNRIQENECKSIEIEREYKNCKNKKSVDQKEWKNRKQKAQYCSVVINKKKLFQVPNKYDNALLVANGLDLI